MNKTIFVLILSIAMLLSASQFASATLAFVGDGTLNFGDSTAARGLSVSQSITITNTGVTPEVGITASNTVASKYILTFTGIPASLGPGASAVITASAFIPWDKAAANEKIGTYSLTATGGSGVTADVNMQAKDVIKISSARAYVTSANGDENDYSVTDTSTKDVKVKPGDSVRVEMTIRNDEPSTRRFDSLDVEVNSDGDADISESDSISSLRGGEHNDVSMSFTIPTDAIDDDTATVTVTAVDDKGATFIKTWDINFNIDRPSHMIDITDISLSPDSITCINAGPSATHVSATVSFQNTGSHDESDVTLELRARDFGYFKRLLNIQLDQDRKTTRTFDIPLNGDIKSGEYLFDVTSYYSTSTVSDTSAQSLTYKVCPSSTPIVQQNKTTTPPPATTTPSNPFISTPYLGEQGKQNSVVNPETMYVVILGLVALLLIIVIIVLVVKFLF